MISRNELSITISTLWSNQQGQMLVQNLDRILSRPNVRQADPAFPFPLTVLITNVYYIFSLYNIIYALYLSPCESYQQKDNIPFIS